MSASNTWLEEAGGRASAPVSCPTEEFGNHGCSYVVVGSVLGPGGQTRILGYYMGDDWVAVALQSLKGLALPSSSTGPDALFGPCAPQLLCADGRAEEALRLSHERFSNWRPAPPPDAIYELGPAERPALVERTSFPHAFLGLHHGRKVESTLDFWKEQTATRRNGRGVSKSPRSSH